MNKETRFRREYVKYCDEKKCEEKREKAERERDSLEEKVGTDRLEKHQPDRKLKLEKLKSRNNHSNIMLLNIAS